MNWIAIDETNYETFPKEGIDCLVTDCKGNYDVAYYLMSSEYVWMKVDLINDCGDNFKGFIIKKWSYIDYEFTEEELAIINKPLTETIKC